MRTLTLIIECDDESFHAFSPDLPGLHVSGEFEEDALRTFGDALSVYMESLIKHGEKIPHSRSEARRLQAQQPQRAQRLSESQEGPE